MSTREMWADEMMEKVDRLEQENRKLRAVVKWSLENGASVNPSLLPEELKIMSGACGCCAEEDVPPEGTTDLVKEILCDKSL